MQRLFLEQSQDQGFTIKIQIFQLVSILDWSIGTRIDCEFDALSQRKNHLTKVTYSFAILITASQAGKSK